MSAKGDIERSGWLSYLTELPKGRQINAHNGCQSPEGTNGP